MKSIKTAIIFLIALNHYFISSAQESTTGNWFMYFGNQKINSNWNWHNEIQYRNYNFAGDLQQMLLRTGIGYNLTENNNNLLAGYAFIHSQNYVLNSDEKTNFDEHRIFQQFITRQRFGRVNIMHRYRLEQRFLPDNFRIRMRYFASVNIPLTLPEMNPRAIYFSGYGEVFINGGSPTFDRGRIYGALGYVIGRHLRAEAGFMSQIQEKTNRNQFQIVLFNNIPFRE
ncbi:MAG: hypothetical protein FD170_3302 [Bacteroidetes bacterium]|nr:MAG: hypothetical protein FD170_3302 [Bacteroidota bacterium]